MATVNDDKNSLHVSYVQRYYVFAILAGSAASRLHETHEKWQNLNETKGRVGVVHRLSGWFPRRKSAICEGLSLAKRTFSRNRANAIYQQKRNKSANQL